MGALAAGVSAGNLGEPMQLPIARCGKGNERHWLGFTALFEPLTLQMLPNRQLLAFNGSKADLVKLAVCFFQVRSLVEAQGDSVISLLSLVSGLPCKIFVSGEQ